MAAGMALNSARFVRVTTAAALLSGVALLLGACSQTPGYPTLPVGDGLGQKTLTQAEQNAEIKDLSQSQVQNTAEAKRAGKPGAELPRYIPASVEQAQ